MIFLIKYTAYTGRKLCKLTCQSPATITGSITVKPLREYERWRDCVILSSVISLVVNGQVLHLIRDRGRLGKITNPLMCLTAATSKNIEK
jgi:hypothetical protein